jgi:hypothetical protein
MSLISDREPEIRVDDANRKVTFRWALRRVEDATDPGLLVVQLTVRHDQSGKRYYAELRNATLTDQGFVVERFALNDPVWSRRLDVGRYWKRGMRTFADRVLAELRRVDAAGEEDLHVDLAGEDQPSPAEADTSP